MSDDYSSVIVIDNKPLNLPAWTKGEEFDACGNDHEFVAFEVPGIGTCGVYLNEVEEVNAVELVPVSVRSGNPGTATTGGWS